MNIKLNKNVHRMSEKNMFEEMVKAKHFFSFPKNRKNL